MEEESEARLDLERQLVKANGEVSIWRSKYETEAQARAEEVSFFQIFIYFFDSLCPLQTFIYKIVAFVHFQVEELRRKYCARIQEQEEQIETLLVKINNLEKQKSRLQSEVEVLIIDLEKVCVDNSYFGTILAFVKFLLRTIHTFVQFLLSYNF